MRRIDEYKDEMRDIVEKFSVGETERFVERLGTWFENHYYSSVKYDVINYALQLWKEKTGQEIVFARKAISTHLSSWFGWRRSLSPKGRQYCVWGHSGYVNCFVIPEKEDSHED